MVNCHQFVFDLDFSGSPVSKNLLIIGFKKISPVLYLRQIFRGTRRFSLNFLFDLVCLEVGLATQAKSSIADFNVSTIQLIGNCQ